MQRNPTWWLLLLSYNNALWCDRHFNHKLGHNRIWQRRILWSQTKTINASNFDFLNDRESPCHTITYTKANGHSREHNKMQRAIPISRRWIDMRVAYTKNETRKRGLAALLRFGGQIMMFYIRQVHHAVFISLNASRGGKHANYTQRSYFCTVVVDNKWDGCGEDTHTHNPDPDMPCAMHLDAAKQVRVTQLYALAALD